MVRKSIFNREDLEEIKNRILSLTQNSQRKWGRMNVSQMMRHCNLVLQVGTGEIILPKTNFILRIIGIATKKEMKTFNNGIPYNMPTFRVVIVEENCNFDKSRKELLEQIDKFVEKGRKSQLLSRHVLFGRMEREDWGFLQYKHLHHHLKQFGI